MLAREAGNEISLVETQESRWGVPGFSWPHRLTLKGRELVSSPEVGIDKTLLQISQLEYVEVRD